MYVTYVWNMWYYVWYVIYCGNYYVICEIYDIMWDTWYIVIICDNICDIDVKNKKNASWQVDLPSVSHGTRQRANVYRVLRMWHTAKYTLFAVCHMRSTRQTYFFKKYIIMLSFAMYPTWHTANLCQVQPTANISVTPFATNPRRLLCQVSCRVSNGTQQSFAVCLQSGSRHRPSLPLLGLPCALCRVQPMAKCLPCA